MLKNLDKMSKIREQKGNFNREIDTLKKNQVQKKGGKEKKY